MNSKELYKKHLKLLTPDKWVSPKQMELIKYEATINAIDEALEIKI